VERRMITGEPHPVQQRIIDLMNQYKKRGSDG
jgi:hypothetical protein